MIEFQENSKNPTRKTVILYIYIKDGHFHRTIIGTWFMHLA